MLLNREGESRFHSRHNEATELEAGGLWSDTASESSPGRLGKERTEEGQESQGGKITGQ